MMATNYTVLINAGNGRRLSDGVEQPTRRRPTSSHTSSRPIRCGRMNCRSSISPAA
jgi:hypothetical protein